jgi:hypothetical protein
MGLLGYGLFDLAKKNADATSVYAIALNQTSTTPLSYTFLKNNFLFLSCIRVIPFTNNAGGQW